MEGVTENISRDGILMRWLAAVPLPAVGSRLTVEFVLPASEGFGQRMMRCRTTVVRIDGHDDGQSSVGMRIDGINFIPVTSGAPTPAELSAMPSVTERIN